MATDTLAPPAGVAAPRIRSELMQQRVRAARWFLVPMLIALAVVAGWPLLRSIYFSFTDASLNNASILSVHGPGAAIELPYLTAVSSYADHWGTHTRTISATGGGVIDLSGVTLLRGGASDAARLLGSRTVGYMTRNHLPGGADLERYGRPLFAETTFDGVGFGLGFAILQDPVANKTLSSAGEYTWGGAASTVFWNDPTNDISVVFLTQLLPSQAHPIRSQLRQLVYQALVD